MALTREQILAADDLPRVEVPIDVWGGPVILRKMTLGEVILLGTENVDEAMGLRIVVMTAINPDGSRMFTDEDIPKLKAKSSEAFTELCKQAMRWNGLGKDAAKESEKN